MSFRIRRTDKEIKTGVEKAGYELINVLWEPYKKLKVNIKDSLGYKYSVAYAKIFQKHPIVSENNIFSFNNICLWLKLNNKTIELIDDNININTTKKLKFHCLICNENFYIAWPKIWFSDHGCPYCSNQKVSDRNRLSILFPELIKAWHFTKNGNLMPQDVSYCSDKVIWWKCSKCNHEWKAVVGDRTRGNGCPKCRTSKGEKRISKFFNNNNVSYIPQYKFPNCKHIRLLSFDFYLSNYNICVEYQGEQHYKSANMFGGEKKFKEVQKRDKIKFDYCQDNNIPLIRIPYWDYDNIENILEKELLKYA